MNKQNLSQGRVKQKLQTRTEILQAAQALMQNDSKISLKDIADKANISRATIYRYFSNIDILFLEAALDIDHKSADEIYEEVKEFSFDDRIFYIQKHFLELAQKKEVVFRRYLSAILSESITSKEPLRGARRVKALHKALESFKDQLDPDTYKNLINISALLTGIDPLLVCKDVCDLDNDAAEDTLKWALEMILKGIAVSKA